MISPAEQKVIQIEITNACPRRCANCTRFVGHHRKPFFMSQEMFRRAVASLEEYPGTIGIMGGEPTIHPRFAQLVRWFADHVPDSAVPEHRGRPIASLIGYAAPYGGDPRGRKRGLWSSFGQGYAKHWELIQDTFSYQCLNDHRHSGEHQALLIQRQELGISDAEWLEYRDRCWIQNLWSASITPKGAYFCEVAASLDMLTDGNQGWPVEPGWWKRTPADFGAQLTLCELCSACLPVPAAVASSERDIVSPAWLRRLKRAKSPKTRTGQVTVLDLKTYEPADYSVINIAEPYLPGGDNGQRVSAETEYALGVRKVEGVTVCVGYGDYLRVTLPRAVRHFDRFVVVTDQRDIETAEICAEHGAECVICSRLHSDGAPFRKGAAVNDGLNALDRDGWILITDCDVIFPDDFRGQLGGRILNPGTLYYTKRWGPELEDLAEFLDRLRAGDPWHRLFHHYGRKVEARHETRQGNDVEHFCFGYFQLFNPGASVLRKCREAGLWYDERYRTAEHADMLFGELWPEKKRETLNQTQDGRPLSAFDVIHLPHGGYKTNWEGRVSARIDSPKNTPPLAVVVAHYMLEPMRLLEWLTWNYDRIRAVGGHVYLCTDRAQGMASGITQVEIPRMSTYSPAKAVNPGIRRACDDGVKVIVKTDIDVFLTDAFLKTAKRMRDLEAMCPVYCYAANIAATEKAEPDMASCGTLALPAEGWRLIHGYDERQYGYGREDGDAYDRALEAGYRFTRMERLVYHIEHQDRKGRFFPQRRKENCEISRRRDWADPDWGVLT